MVDKNIIDINNIKPEEKDINDIIRKVKKILFEGTSFRYIDYFPLLVMRIKGAWIMVMVVIYYGRFEVFPKIYLFSFSSEGRLLELKAYDNKDITK